MESLLVNTGETLTPSYQEEQVAVAELWFRHGGARDLDGERRARYLLESLGVVEIACLDEIETCPGSSAEYVVRVDRNVHALCSFTAYALPQLRALGWRVEMPSDYPFQVLGDDLPWYAHLGEGPGDGSRTGTGTAPATAAPAGAADGDKGWFSLELGIEVDGRRVNLLPALLDLLEQVTPKARLDRLIPPGGRAFALPLGDGRYVSVPPERLRILVKVLDELYQGPPGGQKAAARARAAPFASPPPRPVRWAASTPRSPSQAARRSPGPARRRCTTAGARWPRVRAAAHARRSHRWACARPCAPISKRGCAGCSTCARTAPAGSSPTTWASARRCRPSPTWSPRKRPGGSTLPALIVAPTSVVGNWRRELGRFAPALRVQLVRGAERRYKWADVWRVAPRIAATSCSRPTRAGARRAVAGDARRSRR